MSIHTSRPYPEEPAPPPRQPVSVAMPAVPPTVTYAILAITILVYVLQVGSKFFFGADFPLQLGAKVNTLIRSGELWRLITPVLLHGSILHIGFNMYALLVIGVGIERSMGHVRFLMLYLLGGFAGNVFSFFFSSSASIGASTAIFGLLAAEGVFLYQHRTLFGSRAKRALSNVIVVAAVNLFIGLSPGIDNWGHVGGLLGGLVFTWFGGPRWEVEGIYPLLHLVDRREFGDAILGAAVVVLIFGTLAILGVVYPLNP